METKYLYPKNPKHIKYPIYPFLHKLSDIKNFNSYYKSRNRENILKTKLEEIYKGSEIILTNSGSSALKLALICLNIQPDDEVMFSNFNCPNVIDAVLNLGAKPVFVDIDEDFSLSFDDIKKKVNEKTKAIILTHLYGLKENIKIIDWAKDNHIYVIDDGAQAMFTTQNNKFVGDHGDIGILSFGMTKPLSSIGGGALIIKNEDFLRRLPKLQVESKKEVREDYTSYFKSWLLFKFNNNYILSKFNKLWNKLLKMPKTYTSKLDVLPKSITTIEFKKMNPIREVILLHQFNRLEEINEHNKVNYNEMNDCLGYLQAHGIKFLHLDKDESPNYYTFIFPDENYRYDCSVYLSHKGIQTCWNYIPLDEIPIYSEYKYQTINVDCLWGRVLSIPFKYPLVSKDIQYISMQLKEYLDKSNSFRHKGD